MANALDNEVKEREFQWGMAKVNFPLWHWGCILICTWDFWFRPFTVFWTFCFTALTPLQVAALEAEGDGGEIDEEAQILAGLARKLRDYLTEQNRGSLPRDLLAELEKERSQIDALSSLG